MPRGAVIAQDSAQLQRLLADASGPSEIWLRAQPYVGDFEIHRRVSLRGELGASLVGTGRGTVLRIAADDVIVDNLVIRHSGQRHTAEDAGILAKGRGIQIRNVHVRDSLFGVSFAADPVWNKQPCAHCHMLVSDPSFAGQLVTRSHERLFFDDPGCLADYMHAHPKDVEQAWVHDAASWSSARRARFRAGASSPMGYGFLASASGEHDFAAVTRAAIGRRASGAP